MADGGMNTVLTAVLFLAAFLACCCVAYVIGYDRGFRGAPVQERIDTVTVRETLTVYEPKETVRYRDRLVYVPVTDTLSIHDTTYVALQSEVKVYEDTDYRAVVSGVQPRLVEISVYPKTTIITDTKTIRQRWGFAVTAGPGVVWNGSLHAGVGATVGLSYNF